MPEALESVVGDLVAAVEVCSVFVVCVGVVGAIIGYIRHYMVRYAAPGITALRCKLGQSMVIGLELQVAADAMKTGISPNWRDIDLLAAVIGLRTLLNYLLERELEILQPHPHPAAG